MRALSLATSTWRVRHFADAEATAISRNSRGTGWGAGTKYGRGWSISQGRIAAPREGN